MFQTSFPKETRPAVVKVTRENMSLLVPVDQFDAQDFNKNDCGWTRNDIAQIARAQSLDEYHAIVDRLVEVRQQGGLPDGITDREAFDSIKPRYAQSACEVENFVVLTNDSVMQRVDDAYRKALGLAGNKPTAVKKPASNGSESGSAASE